MAAKKEYLRALEFALRYGYQWNAAQVVEDVLKIAHVLRCLKLSPKLAHAYLCVHLPAAGSGGESLMLEVSKVPSQNIPRLKEQQAVDYKEVWVKALQGVNSNVTHITLIEFAEGHKLQLLLYFKDACERLLKCYGLSSCEKLPEFVAREAKKRGLSASKSDITTSIVMPPREDDDGVVKELLRLSDGRKPGVRDIRSFLQRNSANVTEAAVQHVYEQCIETLALQGVDALRGVAVKGVCRNPTCSKKDAAGKRLFCSKCMRAAYCCKKCQIDDWKQHKLVCVTGSAVAISSRNFAEDLDEFERAFAAKSVFG